MAGHGLAVSMKRDRSLCRTDQYDLFCKCSAHLWHILSYCPHHPRASSTVFARSSPATCHHSLMLLLTLERSPAAKSAKNEYSSIDNVRFVITTSGKRSCDGSLFAPGNSAGDSVTGTMPFGICLRETMFEMCKLLLVMENLGVRDGFRASEERRSEQSAIWGLLFPGCCSDVPALAWSLSGQDVLTLGASYTAMRTGSWTLGRTTNGLYCVSMRYVAIKSSLLTSVHTFRKIECTPERSVCFLSGSRRIGFGSELQ